jgi:hypothetical protein
MQATRNYSLPSGQVAIPKISRYSRHGDIVIMYSVPYLTSITIVTVLVYNHYKGTALDGQHYLAFFRQSLQAKYFVQALIPNKLLRRCQPPRYGD